MKMDQRQREVLDLAKATVGDDPVKIIEFLSAICVHLAARVSAGYLRIPTEITRRKPKRPPPPLSK